MNILVRKSGFTLLELLVVIAIIGVLAVVVISSLNSSRDKAAQAQVLAQVAEYRKALDLVYSDLGEMPNNWISSSNNNFCRIACFGDNAASGGDCLTTLSFGSSYNANHSDEVTAALGAYMSSLPRHTAGIYSGPAYSACVSPGSNYFATDAGNIDPSEAGFKNSHYSLWFVLEGIDADCADAVQVYANFQSNGVTVCRLMGGQ